jgi:hypothetical protein
MLLDETAEQEERTADRQPQEAGARWFPDQHPSRDRVTEIADENESVCPNQDEPP